MQWKVGAHQTVTTVAKVDVSGMKPQVDMDETIMILSMQCNSITCSSKLDWKHLYRIIWFFFSWEKMSYSSLLSQCCNNIAFPCWHIHAANSKVGEWRRQNKKEKKYLQFSVFVCFHCRHNKANIKKIKLKNSAQKKQTKSWDFFSLKNAPKYHQMCVTLGVITSCLYCTFVWLQCA